MSSLLSSFKENQVTFKTKMGTYRFSQLKAVMFIFFFNGLAILLSYLLLGILGNGMMIPVAFLAPAILFYIYTLGDDIVNPLLKKQVDLLEGYIDVKQSNENAADTEQPENDNNVQKTDEVKQTTAQ